MIVAVAFPAASLVFARTTQVGVAGVVQGTVEVAAKDGTVKQLRNGDPVYLDDQLATGSDGHLQVLLMDETVFTLAPSSSIVIDKFIYDPSNDDGIVEAKVVKGIFRFVSGKIAHKKPENMSVDLPAGTIGIRGTMVAGIVDGQRSMIVLLGPVGDETTRPGRIFVSNLVNGETVAVDINEKGYGTIVDGPNVAPMPVFKVSEEELARIAKALYGAEPTSSGQADTGSSGADQTSQTLELMSKMEEFSQKAAQGGMIIPPQPVVVQPVPGGRGDDEDNQKK
jgi:hypothetical protein